MALDDLFNGLTAETERGREVSSNYNPDIYLDSYLSLERLNAVDVQTSEGLKAYREITGEDPTKYTVQEVDYRKKAMLNVISGNRGRYFEKHFGNVVGEIDKPVKTGIAINFCPQIEASGKEYEAYEKTRKKVNSLTTVLRAINDDENKYLEEILRDESDMMKDYIRRMPKEFLEIQKRMLSIRAGIAIGAYGADKFLIDTRDYLDLQKNEYGRKSKSLTEAIIKKLETAQEQREREGKDPLNSVEQAELLRDENEQLRKLAEQYKDIGMIEKFNQSIDSEATKSLLIKREKAKREAEEAEKAKKK